MSTDWTKVVYHRTGTAAFALRGPDGRPFVSENGSVMVIDAQTGCVQGWWPTNAQHYTNTPPVQDWSSKFTLFPDHLDISLGREVTVRAGLRNGRPFAEVVE